ncbi:Tubby-related protein 3 [Phytophthora cinnamomi]|uniref:Tubby-related protein 3 n=1 Tax=Phytophthora cinnamomi TaxID=4785 RepID=UPI00355A6FB1|nr:Tubby-related protein 3 [Phytophthora cinnamomi]
MPSPACNRRLRGLLKDLKKVESVSKALQGEGVSLLDARVWLDGLISIKPHYARFIGPRAEIVHSPDFESGCVKVLGGNTSRLTRAEKLILTPFAVSNQPAETNNDEEEESVVEQLQKRRRLAANETKYKLLHIFPATSKKVERFFSVARITFGHERHGLMPISLEMILFLRENTAYWDAKTVDEAMH